MILILPPLTFPRLGCCRKSRGTLDFIFIGIRVTMLNIKAKPTKSSANSTLVENHPITNKERIVWAKFRTSPHVLSA